MAMVSLAYAAMSDPGGVLQVEGSTPMVM